MKKSKMYRLALGFMLGFSLSLCASCGLSYAAEQEVTYQISQTQLTELNQIIEKQDNRLTLLNQKLEVLMKTSTEQEQELTTVLSQLNESKNQLEETKKNLQSANESLAMAKQTLAEQEKSLNQLETQIKKLEHEKNLAKRQRNVWSIVAGLISVVAVTR